MFYGFNEEEKAFRDVARDFAQKRLAPIAEGKEEVEYNTIAKEMAEMGFTGILLPEEYGGLGGTHTQYCAVVEELSKVTTDFNVAISKAQMDGRGLIRYASPELREKYLPRMINGELRCSTSLTEPNTGSDASGIQCFASKDDEGNWHINGNKMFTSQICNEADVFFVACQTDKKASPSYKGIAAFLVDKETPGISYRSAGEIVGDGKYMKATAVYYDDVVVPESQMVGKVGQGFMAISSALDVGRLTIAAAAVGVCQHAIDETIKYVKERKQFGREIGQFQLVQGRLADMIVETEAARSLMYRAASLCDQDAGGRLECSMAKLYCSEVAQRVTYNAVQLHGGYGLCEEYPVIKLWLEARKWTIVDGASDIHKLLIGRNATGFNALKR